MYLNLFKNQTFAWFFNIKDTCNYLCKNRNVVNRVFEL